MKKQLLLSLIFTLLCGFISGQHLIRVNNNPGADGDYTNLQAAQDAASNGDTIYVEGSITDYAGADISKRVIIIGPGYFLTDNDSTQAFGASAEFEGDISFNAGSAGSIIMGCKVSEWKYIRLGDNDISVIRCTAGDITNSKDITNILVTQNYLGHISFDSYRITNLIISNNIIDRGISCGIQSGPVQIVNNVITTTAYQPIGCYNASIANNICCSPYNGIADLTGNTINNNILASPGTNANGNQYNVPMANVFIDFSGALKYSYDAKWKLKTGSPAIGAGVSGVDCGVFGGATPYVLSGVPNLPHIYEASIPGTAYSDKGLACTIKVKSGK
jgi:hypothetical protein